jgi:hypothetical protein
LAKPRLFPPFLSLIYILPICFDSAQVLYISSPLYTLFYLYALTVHMYCIYPAILNRK